MSRQAVALYYVTKLARQYVKVLISGEGGDEAFGGYPNYRSMVWMERLKSVLGPLTPLFAQCVSLLNQGASLSNRVRYTPCWAPLSRLTTTARRPAFIFSTAALARFLCRLRAFHRQTAFFKCCHPLPFELREWRQGEPHAVHRHQDMAR